LAPIFSTKYFWGAILTKTATFPQTGVENRKITATKIVKTPYIRLMTINIGTPRNHPKRFVYAKMLHLIGFVNRI
jgi:hypothetical protein